ncbi:hypothetical protein Bhyg_02274, partial [Pseudolycoriella hygida]
DPCPGLCGLSAQCSVINHTPICTCLDGYEGDAFTSCHLIPPQQEPLAEDPCNPSPCGPNAVCNNEQEPLAEDPCNPSPCGPNAVCNNEQEPLAEDPCNPSPCGPNAVCNNEQEPLAEDPCNPSPCGPNAVCNNGVCTCLAEYQGDPYTGCRPECVLNSDCPRDKACLRSKCVNPCSLEACAQNAICE